MQPIKYTPTLNKLVGKLCDAALRDDMLDIEKGAAKEFYADDGKIGDEVSKWLEEVSENTEVSASFVQLTEEFSGALKIDRAPGGDGYDISAGLYGYSVSQWLMSLANKIDNPPASPK